MELYAIVQNRTCSGPVFFSRILTRGQNKQPLEVWSQEEMAIYDTPEEAEIARHVLQKGEVVKLKVEMLG